MLGSPNNNMSPQLSETDELSETESANGAQAMSVSTPDDGDKNLNADEDIQSDFDSTVNIEQEDDIESDTTRETSLTQDEGSHNTGVPPGGKWIEPEPDSVVSDYSEMADPLKEHLANVQIIQKEDLDVGNTMFSNQFSVGQKIMRSPDETEEEFTKRLRKINYLSLAQEFAALKKIDADALPFDLRRAPQDLTRIRGSPMSETSSETDPTDSSTTTPMEVIQEFAPLVPNPIGVSRVSTSSKLTERFERAIKPKEAWSKLPSGDKPDNQSSGDGVLASDPALQRAAGKVLSSGNINANVDEPDSESKPLMPGSGNSMLKPEPIDKKLPNMPSPGTEKLGDFDVYNIETTLPQLDWTALEAQLQRAAEEERQKHRVSCLYSILELGLY